MRYLSVCSGIEAATQAFHPLGWSPVAFSEIEKFPSAVLAHHYPHVPNWGDMTKFEEWPDEPVDLLCGGTPCQSFSVAGLRAGLADPRGNLMLTFGAIAAKYRPRWLVWENVPGVLSSNSGRDFGTFLGMLGQLGYGTAYRVLDAQHVRTLRFPFAVPQRRRRVWVVAYLGDWRRAAAVLFDRESLSGHSAPRRETGEISAATLAASTGGCSGKDAADRRLIAARMVAFGEYEADDTASTVKARDYKDATDLVAHSLRGEGFDASEDGTGRGTPIVPVAFVQNTRDEVRLMGGDGQIVGALAAETGAKQQCYVATQAIAIQERAVCENPNAGPDGKGYREDGAAYTLESRTVPQAVAFDCLAGGETGFSIGDIPGALHGGGKSGGRAAVAFDMRGREGGAMPEGPHDTVSVRAASGGSSRSYVALPWAVRRLTPRECERLQGFPDDFTLIPNWAARASREDLEQTARWIWTDDNQANGMTWDDAMKLARHPDGPRYKALGNSWAVNCAEWIAERIAMVDAMEGAA
ncbi:DNA cytosine methyltransferase [Paracoccus sp. Z330]|uniref:Cytosine-specific methyltransferase n=1 Tax=Paracoccus onchidii TaxID=3017813 RepID=A0ABT4ZHZ5_9RHOB|nr:DNA cytosine methyltransferase [Paracoccus onchidii]MDB6178979.1 DNA cytosine methyltransferase [Paracoccus onchidii]